jgi:transposase
LIICPLGIAQDGISHVAGKRISKKTLPVFAAKIVAALRRDGIIYDRYRGGNPRFRFGVRPVCRLRVE